MQNQESITRKDFLMKMGFRGAALMAVLTSCSSENVSPSSSGSLEIDLTASSSSVLKNVGGYLKTGNIIIARIGTGDTGAAFAAIARICPHEKKDKIVYVASSNRFRCTEHDWYFKTDGTGVGNSSITAFKVSVSGNTLTIS